MTQRRQKGYDYTCALTGYRLVTLASGTIVDAAHIHQFARSRNNASSPSLSTPPTGRRRSIWNGIGGTSFWAVRHPESKGQGPWSRGEAPAALMPTPSP